MKNKYKNFFHIEPTKGLLNDPNGLVQFKGTYYFFHQWNRFNTNHNYKGWGLFTSDNLVNWQSEGSALLPDSSEDKNGVYSGSAVEHDGKMYIFYTGNRKKESKRKSYQRTVVSEDGKTFVKLKETIRTPDNFSEHYRDPKVVRMGNEWWMIVGAQTINNEGATTVYSSNDLINWDYQGIFFIDPKLDQMCECPDLFSLAENIDILAVCPQKRTPYQESDMDIESYSGYFVGQVDLSSRRFSTSKSIIKFDCGFDFYAPQTFLDDKGRRIMVGWMSRMNEKEEISCPTIGDGYIHCLTVARQLVWRNNKLYQIPLDEFQSLRKNKQVFSSRNLKYKNTSKSYEIVINFNELVSQFDLSINSQTTLITFKNHQLQIGRLNWVSGRYEQKDVNVPSLFKLQIFCDTSTVEIFINDGEYVFSMRVFNHGVDRDIEYDYLNKSGIVAFYSYQ